MSLKQKLAISGDTTSILILEMREEVAALNLGAAPVTGGRVSSK
ncbi:MAG: hypothetical protein AAB738_03320 [Patescibacteria group bacterium]